MQRVLVLALCALAAAAPGRALAWGSTGHRLIGEAAARALPADLPAFLRTPQAVRDIGELSREPDRSKGAGRAHDADRDPGHYVDLTDDGTILGGPTFETLPPTRGEYETALRAAGADNWKAGYLPYSIVDRWQQLSLDFAYWRVLRAAETNSRWAGRRAWFAADRRRREAKIRVDLGELSHFVADGSQPLHVSVHYNGWGAYPNPAGYTQAKIHAPFEGELVRGVAPAQVAARMAPLRLCRCPIERRTAEYLAGTGRLVAPLYELEKAGGIAPGDPRGLRFAADQLGRGASELRDLVVEAWRTSPDRQVGWKPVIARELIAGNVDPYPVLYGRD
jgi:hypothetical protein